MSSKKQKHKLYKEYLQDLEAISGPFNATASEKRQWCSHYFDKDYYHWIDIIYDEHVVGFLIMAQKPDCHPDCDYFIAQSYVKLKYRHKHLMTNTVHEFVTKHKGKYCLAILNENKFAYKFWFQLFKDLCYKPMKLSETENTFEDDVTQYGFEPL